jgi:hypothetical protein
VTLTDEDIKQMEMDARRFQGAWTGTSGTLASHIVNLIKHLSERRRERSRLPRPAAPGRLSSARVVRNSWLKVRTRQQKVARW